MKMLDGQIGYLAMRQTDGTALSSCALRHDGRSHRFVNHTCIFCINNSFERPD